ncbi:MAG: flagellar protein export ATPase FliI [Proteobacteria bacterium]|nr:flagellar protein export ATPase FliI [Pseudomonadota bacterium]NOG58940.1 flagellar protein export ATPase FliI [Pseudomonadota bacterium]
MQVDSDRRPVWKQKINHLIEKNRYSVPLVVQGRLIRMVGLTLEAAGCRAAIGDYCRIKNDQNKSIDSEVVGFSGDNLFLMPTGRPHGLSPNARVVPLGRTGDVAVGPELLGRVINGAGQPLDDGPPIKARDKITLNGSPINPLSRENIKQPMDVGVRTINTFFTLGRGQRMGLFASSGVGKSVLLGMMARFTEADVIVVGLIGERGREVKEFIEHSLGQDGLSRSVVIATPADDSPLMRLHGALLATSVAEYFRDQGQHVLLLMDSLTRFAQAQREIALTIGEPPATRGYPPSVFARLPELVERAGNGANGQGSITAIYTVLTEIDADNDPIADSARAILDGHIVLSKKIAESGIYPAINLELSISRVMNLITDQEHQKETLALRHLNSIYQQNKDLISVGAYQPGADPELDLAIKLQPDFLRFINQGMNEKVNYAQSIEQLKELADKFNQDKLNALENNPLEDDNQ